MSYTDKINELSFVLFHYQLIKLKCYNNKKIIFQLKCLIWCWKNASCRFVVRHLDWRNIRREETRRLKVSLLNNGFLSLVIIDRLLFYGHFTGRFLVAKQTMKRNAQFSVRRHASRWERTTPARLQFFAVFNYVYPFAWWRLKFFIYLWPKSREYT